MRNKNLPAPVVHQPSAYYYRLEAIARMVSMEPTLIREYEIKGLIPNGIISREGDEEIISYPSEVLETLRKIKLLTEEMEVNLPGVEIILNLLKRLEEE